MSADIDLHDGNWLRYPDAEHAFKRGRRSLQALKAEHPEIAMLVGGAVYFNRQATTAVLCRALPTFSPAQEASEAPSSGQTTTTNPETATVASTFPEHLLDILPSATKAKLQRLDAEGNNAELLARAARDLELHGAHDRFVRFGIRPAHVEPVNNHVAAVADVRDRIAEVDAYAAALPGKVASGELLDVWADVFTADAMLSRVVLERTEEAIIDKAADAGTHIERRSDVNIAAFLEIEAA